MSLIHTPILRKAKAEETSDNFRQSEALSEFEIVPAGAPLDPGFKSDRPEETENPILSSNHPFVVLASAFFCVGLAITSWNIFHLAVMIRYAILCRFEFSEWYSFVVWESIFHYNIIFDISCTITAGIQDLAFGYLVYNINKLRRQELYTFVSLLAANLIGLIIKYLILFLYGTQCRS